MRRVRPETRGAGKEAPATRRKTARARKAAPPAQGAASGSLPDGSQADEPRDRLLHAAAAVFARGFARASVASIVKRAGVSRRTFYEHFDDLTDALVQLYDASAEVLLQIVATALRSASTPEARLAAAVEAYVLAIATNADLARIVYGEIRAAGPDHALRHQATLARFSKLLTRWAAEARAARLIRKLPDEATIFATLSGIEGAAMHFVYLGEQRRLAEAVPRFVEFALNALR